MADNPITKQSTQETIDTVDGPVRLASLRSDALYTGQLTPLLKNQYGIFIWDTVKGGTADATGLSPANPSAPPEYFFSMAPKVYEMGDPFATQITATQSGGKFVESHGSIIKNIRISGTTGARPNRGLGEFSGIPLVGEALNQLDSNINVLAVRDRRRAVPASESTGFDDIIFLRNIFRRYSDYRENNESSNNIVMVWYNAKEGDSWIVEPTEFKINRNASSPLTYEYNIVFQTLAPFDKIIIRDTTDPLAKVLSVRKIFSRVQEYNRTLKNTFLIVSTQVRRLEGLGVFAQSQLLDPIINVTRGLGVIRATATNFGSKLRHNALVLSQELDNAIDLLSGTEGVEAQDALVRTLRRTQVTAARILAEPGVKESVNTDASSRQTRYAGSYITSGGTTSTARIAPDLGGSTTFIGNNAITDRVAQDFVNAGEDIRSVAGRLLGDKGAWHVLAAVNGLSSPYISSDGRAGTLSVGDPILYPSSTSAVNSSTINPVNTSDSETAGKDTNTLGPIQQVYGRDIRVESIPVANSGVVLTDLKVNQSGDISTIVGIPNVEQAIILKFSTEQGELPVHSGYGASIPIGSKATVTSLNDFRVKTIATLTSDSRIKSIKSIAFVTIGDVLVVNAALILVNATDSLDTSVSLRRV
jgi:hypothetical protein